MKTLIDVFNQTLNKEPSWKKSKDFKPSFKIKPSMLGSKCMRKCYYSSSGVPEDFPFPLDGKKRMKLGDAVHDMLHEVFKEAGVLIEYYNPDGSIQKDWTGKNDFEFPLTSPELFIKKGKVDAIVILDGKLWVVEYKSINSNGFNELAQPKGEHIIQATTYYYVFNQHLQEGKFSHIKELQGFTKAEGVRYLYVNKDDTNFKEFVYSDTDFIFQQIVQKIVDLKQAFDSKTLPPKTQDWCQSCSWRNKCKQNFNI